MLLRLPTASVGDLAAGLGMSMMDARAALRGLEAKGLVGRLPGAANRFQAAPPEQALGPLVRRRHRELRTIRADVDALGHEYRERDGAGIMSSVRLIAGVDAIHAQAEQLIAGATSEICIVAPGVTEEFATAPGVRIRAIHPRPALRRPEDRARLASLLAGGHHARVVARPPADMLIVDRTVALLPVHGETGGGLVTSAVVVWPGGLHDTLRSAFERSWSVGTAVRSTGADVAEDADGEMPTDDDLRLLEMLLEGLTDQAIAGRFGVGERTVQRRVRDLIDLVGVQTRIQLIWQAAQRGWI